MAVLASTVIVAAAPTVAEASDASTLASLVNRERVSRGLRRLAVDSELTSLALRHTYAMIRAKRIYHSRNPWILRADGWRAAGENVGLAGTTSQVHSMFMKSSSHRAVILQPLFDHIGVGALRSGGRLWVTELFGGGPPARRIAVRARMYRPSRSPARAPVRAAPRPAAAPVMPVRTLDILLELMALDGAVSTAPRSGGRVLP